MSAPRAALITGHHGVGKSTVLEEVADIPTQAGVRDPARDLDGLGWAPTGPDS